MRLPLLALLARGPAHGYELKQDLEQLLGSAYPQPNVGQIYVTLGRLEKSGLIEGEDVEQSSRPNGLADFDCRSISSPSRKTTQRNPSHFGS